MRIQKYLSQEGLLSRREAEDAVKKGLIRVNGEKAHIGQIIEPHFDKIELDDALIKKQSQVIMFHKPRGIITNCPQEGEIEITELLPKDYRQFFCIGRLDKDSEGLILLTNSGIIAQQALRQKLPHYREYLVWLDKPLTTEIIFKLEQGVEILGKKTLPLLIRQLGGKYCKITLQEGKNRQIRRMMKIFNLNVVRLKRITFGPLKLEDLEKGTFRPLSQDEIKKIVL